MPTGEQLTESDSSGESAQSGLLRGIAPSRVVVTRMLVLMLVINSFFMMAIAPAAANHCGDGTGSAEEAANATQCKFVHGADWLAKIIVGVALLVGTWGALTLMTAGGSVEKQSDGKQRLVYTGAALVLAGVIKAVVFGLGYAMGLL